jgi:heat shock protein HslJ
MYYRCLILLSVLGTVYTGCTPQAPRGGGARVNDVWALEAIGEQRLRSAEASPRLDRPTLELNLDENRVTGTDGCNRFMGTVEVAGASELVFGALASTKMACLDDGGIPEQITSALSRVTNYRIDGVRLILLDDDGESLLTYRRTD